MKRTPFILHSTQLTRMRIDDKSMYLDIVWYQRMIDYSLNSFPHGLLRIPKSIKPFFEIHSTIAYHIYRFLMNATSLHVLYHLLRTHVASTTIAMRHHHHIGHPQFKDGYQQTTDDTTERMRSNPPAFFIIFTSPFLTPNAAGISSVNRVSMQDKIAIFLSGYLFVINFS